MALNHVRPGNTIYYVNSGSTPITSGDLIAVGDIAAVSFGDIAPGLGGELAVTEVWQVPKTSGTAIGQGARLYLHSATGKVDTSETAASGETVVLAGYAWQAAAAADTMVQCRLRL